jgi:hypothetical protein
MCFVPQRHNNVLGVVRDIRLIVNVQKRSPVPPAFMEKGEL